MAKDFAPVGLIASVPIVIMSNPSVPAKTLSEVIALAKKEPTKSRSAPRRRPPPTILAPNNSGDDRHQNHDRNLKGTGPPTNHLVGGHVMLAFNTLPPAIGNIQAGTLRAIAVGHRHGWPRSPRSDHR